MHSLSECFFSSVVRYLDMRARRFVFISHIDFHFNEFFFHFFFSSYISLRTSTITNSQHTHVLHSEFRKYRNWMTVRVTFYKMYTRLQIRWNAYFFGYNSMDMEVSGTPFCIHYYNCAHSVPMAVILCGCNEMDTGLRNFLHRKSIPYVTSAEFTLLCDSFSN